MCKTKKLKRSPSVATKILGTCTRLPHLPRTQRPKYSIRVSNEQKKILLHRSNNGELLWQLILQSSAKSDGGVFLVDKISQQRNSPFSNPISSNIHFFFAFFYFIRTLRFHIIAVILVHRRINSPPPSTQTNPKKAKALKEIRIHQRHPVLPQSRSSFAKSIFPPPKGFVFHLL